MEYTTNDNLLTIQEKYLHSIFHIAHTSQIGKLNFSVKGVRKGGLGLTPPLELDILQKLYYLRKEIKCFRILFACLFVDLMQIPRNKFACKFQGAL